MHAVTDFVSGREQADTDCEAWRKLWNQGAGAQDQACGNGEATMGVRSGLLLTVRCCCRRQSLATTTLCASASSAKTGWTSSNNSRATARKSYLMNWTRLVMGKSAVSALLDLVATQSLLLECLCPADEMERGLKARLEKEWAEEDPEDRERHLKV